MSSYTPERTLFVVIGGTVAFSAVLAILFGTVDSVTRSAASLSPAALGFFIGLATLGGGAGVLIRSSIGAEIEELSTPRLINRLISVLAGAALAFVGGGVLLGSIFALTI